LARGAAGSGGWGRPRGAGAGLRSTPPRARSIFSGAVAIEGMRSGRARLRGRFKEAPGRGGAAGGRARSSQSVRSQPRGPPGGRAGAALPPPRRGRGGGDPRAGAQTRRPRTVVVRGLGRQGAPAGALFWGGRCGRPLSGAAALPTHPPGAPRGPAARGLLPRSRAPAFTVCDREVDHGRDPRGEGLLSARTPFAVITPGFFGYLDEDPAGRGRRDWSGGKLCLPL
jgi:hypothetical protein